MSLPRTDARRTRISLIKRLRILNRSDMPKIKIDAADRAFSLFIRTRDNWTCQRCKTKYEPPTSGLHCSHFWGRGNENTRFDPENATSHCYGCHSFLTANPQEHRDWKLKQLGEKRYKALDVRAHTYCKKDRKMALLVAQQMLKDLSK